MIYVREAYVSVFAGERSLEDFLVIEGEVLRHVKNRRTITFCRDTTRYYMKRHLGVGWGEILRDLVRARRPVIGAMTEWRAIRHLNKVGILTMTPVAFGVQGRNPAQQRSFIITEDIGPNISLEAYTADWYETPPPARVKSALVRAVAGISRRLHESGMNHRDYYLCHFLLAKKSGTAAVEPPLLYLVDLHRAQLRRRTGRRWLVKDLSGLLFSSLGSGIVLRDLVRFVEIYRDRPFREVMQSEGGFWRAVCRRAVAMYRAHGYPESRLKVLRNLT